MPLDQTFSGQTKRSTDRIEQQQQTYCSLTHNNQFSPLIEKSGGYRSVHLKG
ncbi:MAG: hypothetical protein WCA35_29610 [Kovacikia sp.]